MRRYSAAVFALLVLAALVARGLRREESLPAADSIEEAPSPPMVAADPREETVPSREEVAKAPSPRCCTGEAPAATKSAVPAALEWLSRHQNEDGSWGGEAEMVDGHLHTKAGATALALLAYLGAGYSHLSKDYIGDAQAGDTIKKALKWLFENPGENALDTGLVGLALSEAYGVTGSQLLKDPALQQLERIAALQRPDGSWEGDVYVSTWAAQALKSGEIAGLERPPENLHGAGSWFAGGLGSLEPRVAAGYVFTHRVRDNDALASARALLVNAPPNWSQQDFAYWYLGSLALFQMDGPAGDDWKAWSACLKTTLGEFQNDSGAWREGKTTWAIVTNATAALTMEVYYRYAAVFGAKE